MNQGVFSNAEPSTVECWMENFEKKQVLLSITRTPYLSSQGAVEYVICTATDITEQEHHKRVLENLSFHDELTGIANRRGFFDCAEKFFKQSIRNNQATCCLMVDVDHFKQYNDSFGHVSGDECLRVVARAITDACKRPLDFVGRYGGEEFIAILAETRLAEGMVVAQRVMDYVRKLNIPHPQSTYGILSVSIGIACTAETTGESLTQLVSRADQKLYRAKQAGRNTVVY